MEEEKLKFIRSQIFNLSVAGALSRGKPIYKKVGSLEERKNFFKNFLAKRMTKYESTYKETISDEQHIREINNLKDEINEKFSDILNIYFGRAQKLLNLYLKYFWVLGFIPEPRQCPFDSVIIAGLKANVPAWTKPGFSEEHYRKLVELAEIESKKEKLSIAQWELKFWNKNLEKLVGK